MIIMRFLAALALLPTLALAQPHDGELWRDGQKSFGASRVVHSPNGLLMGVSDYYLILRDAATLRWIAYDAREPGSICFTPDSGYLAAVEGSIIEFFETSALTPAFRLDDPDLGSVGKILMKQDLNGDLLLFARTVERVAMWRRSQGVWTRDFIWPVVGFDTQYMCQSKDRRFLAVRQDMPTPGVAVFDTVNRSQVPAAFFDCPTAPTEMAFFRQREVPHRAG